MLRVTSNSCYGWLVLRHSVTQQGATQHTSTFDARWNTGDDQRACMHDSPRCDKQWFGPMFRCQGLRPGWQSRSQQQQCAGGKADARRAVSQASVACQHLLSRMLQPDPAQRATMAEVLAHPWVAAAMPPALASLNDDLLQVWRRVILCTFVVSPFVTFEKLIIQKESVK